MALSALIQLYVEPLEGDDDNGGGFSAIGAGQNLAIGSPAIITDLEIDGVDATMVTSAGYGFTSNDEGNVLNVLGGTGFTVQRVVIDSVALGVATCSDALGTLGATGGQARLGGSFATLAAARAAAAANDNNIWYLVPDQDAADEMRSLWRELTGEFHTDVVPDDVVDQYLGLGLAWLNHATEYHWTTSDGGVTLVAGTQEYTLDESVVRVEQVDWNGLQLTRGDIEEWRNSGEEWRREPAGFPEQWAVYGGRTIVFRPKPSAAAAAAAASPEIRHVSTPLPISTAGPVQTVKQDRKLAVYRAVALWSIAYPDSALAMQRAEGFFAKANEEGAFTVRDTQAKGTKR